MTEEGKFSRAMSKAGSTDRAQHAAPEKVEQGAAADAGSKLRRAQQPCGEPADRVVMVHDRFGEVASQIRALRARVLALRNGTPPRVLTISSGGREEGKTTLTVNLAAALAELGEGRVCIVDGDLAAPGLHLVTRLEADTGLNEMLRDGVRLDGNIYETAIPGVDIVPSRPVHEDEGIEGLLSRRCKDLFKMLRQHYAYVIVDTPPVLSASQACVFGRNSDGVLVVVRLEKTPREVVRRTLDELRHSGADVLGCVLTHRKHHVPDFIYRLFGSTPRYYYGYSRQRNEQRTKSP